MKKIVTYGFLIWLIPFLISFFIFPIHESNRPLFDTIMAVVLVATTLFFTFKFFDDKQKSYTRDGLTIGLLWMAINLVIDGLIFIAPTPLQMTPMEYISDIGLMYLIIPLITFTAGNMLSDQDNDRLQSKHS